MKRSVFLSLFQKSMRVSKQCLAIMGVFFLFFSLTAGSATAQNSKSADRVRLEKEKKENLQKIKEAQRILSETSTRKESSIGQLNAINEQIGARESLIRSINMELDILKSQIDEISSVIIALEEDLVKLKREYAYMVYAASKTSNSYDRLTFIFAAETFNQMFMRIKYLQQYSEARRNQVEQIQKVAQTLLNQREVIVGKRMEQKVLLDQQVNANKELLALKAKQRAVIRELNEQETELKKEVSGRKAAISKLDNLIADLIKKEIKETSKGRSSTKIELNASAKALSESFENSRAKLRWPVNSGFISQRFGYNPHPVMKNIMVPNDGIDIQTNQNAQVTAVFPGIVKTVASVPGMNKVVILQHGDYFTLYARLKDVAVKRGQQLSASDVVGSVYTDSNGMSALQFQIWRNNEKLNPEPWLEKK